MVVQYDRTAAVAYAKRFSDRPCHDLFVILNPRATAPQCRNKPFISVPKDAVFKGGSLSKPNGTVVIPTTCLWDAAHFVCCCVGSPPGERGGGLTFNNWDASGKSPYGDREVSDLVRRLEADSRLEVLVSKSVDRTIPDGIQPGDIVAYWDGADNVYYDVAIYGDDMVVLSHYRWGGPIDWDYPHSLPDHQWTVFHVRTLAAKAKKPTKTKQAPSNKFSVFTLLEHFWADPAYDNEAWNVQQAVPLEPGKMNPGFWDGAKTKVTPDLQSKVNAAISSNPDFKPLRFAVAQLFDVPLVTALLVGSPVSGPVVAYAANVGTEGHPEERDTSNEPRDTEAWESVSCGKLALLYAAYQLRFDVLTLAARNRRDSARKSGPKRWETPQELFAGVEAEWSKRQVPDGKAKNVLVRPSNPKIELHDAVVLRDGAKIPLVIRRGNKRLNTGPPKLKEIFHALYDPKTGWSIRFIGEPPDNGTDSAGRPFWAKNDLQLFEQPLKDDQIRWLLPLRSQRTFFELLWMVINASHNHGGTLVLDKLGYLYVNSLMWQSDLFNAARGGGLLLARNFGGGDTNKTSEPPSQFQPNEWEFWDMTGNNYQGLLVPVIRKTPDGDVIKASLSAAAGVAFMVLLQRDKLVNAPACLRMKVMLDRLLEDPRGGPDDVTDNSLLGRPAGSFKHIWSKIGIGGPRPGGTKNVSDCVLLVKKTDGVTYAATCLDSYGSLANISDKIFGLVT